MKPVFRILALVLIGAALMGRPPPAMAGDDAIMLAPKASHDFYWQRNGKLAWNDARDYEALIIALAGLAKHGLNPADYHLAELQKYRNNVRKRDRIATDAWFSAAAHMLYGKLDPQTVEPEWTAAGRDIDLAEFLNTALEKHGVDYSLDLLAPHQPGYWALVGALAKARTQANTPHTEIPGEGRWLQEGMSGDRVKSLQQRLVELGLLDAVYQTGEFDHDTDTALKQFQLRSGLEPDGLVGPKSLAALNRGPMEEIDKIRINLERWRWLPEKLGKKHIRVNIADFHLTSWLNGAPVRTYPIIVGRTYRQTPVFSGDIEYIVFNPWWETPAKLAREDELPAFRKDPAKVKQLGFHVLDKQGNEVAPDTIDWNTVSANAFPYRLRQAPGEHNALGMVKIMFPNKHGVYIHDTPRRDLFDEYERTFSSGCIRTKNVLDLAAWLLNDQEEWTTEHIAEVVDSKKTTRVALNSSVPVYILYMTAVVKNYGAVRFLDDIYKRDNAVLEGLNETPAQTQAKSQIAESQTGPTQ